MMTGIEVIWLSTCYLFMATSLARAEISHWTKDDATDSSFRTCQHSDCLMIDRHSNLSLREFVEKYDGKRPVLITDVLQNFGAMNWSKEYFSTHYGDQKVFMKAVQGAMRQAESFAVRIDVYSQHSNEGKPGLWTYVEDELFIQTHPELKKDLKVLEYLQEDFFELLPTEVRPWNAMLLWGTPYSRSSLHIDPYNWTGTNAVFYGSKTWKLYPPGQDEYLYVYDKRRCNFPLDCFKYNSPVDAFAPDHETYPLFHKAKAITFTQKAGELLIIPTGWFHQAFNPEETIAVSSQVMNTQNYKIVIEEIFKAGEIEKNNVPANFEELSPVEQVKTIARLIPDKVLAKGKKVTKDILNQLK